MHNRETPLLRHGWALLHCAYCAAEYLCVGSWPQLRTFNDEHARVPRLAESADLQLG